MKKIAVVTPRCPSLLTSAVIAPYSIFNAANDFLQSMGRPPAYEVQIVGGESNSRFDGGVFSVQPHVHFSRSGAFDLVLVPGFTGDASQPLSDNDDLLDWLRMQHLEYGAELGSLCTGAFLVAATGLADGKKSTTHWAWEAEFRTRFPRVRLLPEHIVTDDRGIYASGGAYSSLNLVLYLLEKFSGKESAVWTSKIFQIDPDRVSQKPFVIFNRQKTHSDEDIARVQEYIERSFHQPLTVKNLTEKFAFSTRNFIRRFKAATGNTPIEYIQRVRVEGAKRLLEQSRKSIGEIVGEAGYSDEKTFRAMFRRYTGFSPGGYRERYGRNG